MNERNQDIFVVLFVTTLGERAFLWGKRGSVRVDDQYGRQERRTNVISIGLEV